MTDFPKQYDPKTAEPLIQDLWKEKEAFRLNENITGETFYIPMPPPNVTGNLHI